MSADFAFTAAFLEFVSNDEWVTQSDDGVPVLASDGGRGEVHYHVIALESGGYQVTRSVRSADPVTVLEALETEVVERYLATELGAAMRDTDEFLLLWNVDPDVEAPAPGYRLQRPGESEWVALVDESGMVIPAQFRKDDAISYSYTAHAALDDLFVSFLDPAGQPALHDALLRWQERIRA
ncbi:Imm61 family immunity protein [Salinibacterium sp. ZJ77]|uniref:Imm61 family immunity protein n=1 Tax=Salinibacterium sp. ZJ77 TaxID=2708337 RepID=UPI0014215CC0|nr:Imm61 family immunity protein [Salinibacterium sp. ZJ77]